MPFSQRVSYHGVSFPSTGRNQTLGHKVSTEGGIQQITSTFLPMKLFSMMMFFSLLSGAAKARLFRKRGKIAPNVKGLPKKSGKTEHKRVPLTRPPKTPKPIQKIAMDEKTVVSTKVQPEDIFEVQRKTNEVRVTLTNVEEISFLSSAETMFFEDCFMTAFVESQTDGDDDIHVRSMIVLRDSSTKKNRLRQRDRSLWRTPGRYFDIAALFEWSCRFCGISSARSSTGETLADDDHTDDDFYFNGPQEKSPTTYPTSRPTTFVQGLDDDHSDDDFYFNGPTRVHTTQLDDDHTDDTFYFSGNKDSKIEDWSFGNTLRDDDVFSFFFGKRVLEESDERRFEELLCRELRAGPFQAFHLVGECYVVFMA